MPKSNLDLINDCDSFPYDTFPSQQSAFTGYYTFLLPNDARPHGLLTSATVQSMPWTSDFRIDHSTKTVHLLPASHNPADLASSCTSALSNLITKAIQTNTFPILHGKHSEPYPILGAPKGPISIERFARSLFGLTARGAHLTVYTRTVHGLSIWVPRRSPTLFTYPHCLDTTVAGGVTTGEDPFTCIVREAAEEASLPEELVRTHARSCGVLSYMGLRDEARGGGGGEQGLVTPDLIYVFDLEVGEEVRLEPGDDEVEAFYLWDVETVRRGLAEGGFKTNSAVVMVDFLMRHGVVRPETEGDYVEIAMRMHRRLPFPVSARQVL
ncbi:MAG: hypothetical protein HETSPECPRED_008830 [Heterodermia speciosa]|uniref:Nudix hydrolase domain-containing protein n=1 Tax=Heterodermia speciosa TaxID=116794 RepID=A0A8H3ID14_9LECA|nr:MAG: hypothetical protein HETSPECPRED_008830 [Heterodermia speciosa]